MAKKYEEMTVDELKKELLRLEDDLEGLEEDKALVLGQQGQHIDGAAVSARFDGMLNDARGKIGEVKSLIGKK